MRAARRERADARFGVLEQPSPQPNAITDLDSLVAELGRVCERGCATSDEELERGVAGAARDLSAAPGYPA